jgi:Helix-turn-helix domain
MTDDRDGRIEATIAALLAYCRNGAGIPLIGADLRVTEAHAAALLGLAPETLRAMRSSGQGPAFFRVRRVSYRIADLAAWLEERRSCGGNNDEWDREIEGG